MVHVLKCKGYAIYREGTDRHTDTCSLLHIEMKFDTQHKLVHNEMKFDTQPKLVYQRLGFEYEILLIAYCEFLYKAQSKESQKKRIITTSLLLKPAYLSAHDCKYARVLDLTLVLQ